MRSEISLAEQLVAICRRGVMRQKIGILELPLPKPVPAGAEWIEAYRRWSTGGDDPTCPRNLESPVTCRTGSPLANATASHMPMFKWPAGWG